MGRSAAVTCALRSLARRNAGRPMLDAMPGSGRGFASQSDADAAMSASSGSGSP